MKPIFTKNRIIFIAYLFSVTLSYGMKVRDHGNGNINYPHVKCRKYERGPFIDGMFWMEPVPCSDEPLHIKSKKTDHPPITTNIATKQPQ